MTHHTHWGGIEPIYCVHPDEPSAFGHWYERDISDNWGLARAERTRMKKLASTNALLQNSTLSRSLQLSRCKRLKSSAASALNAIARNQRRTMKATLTEAAACAQDGKRRYMRNVATAAVASVPSSVECLTTSGLELRDVGNEAQGAEATATEATLDMRNEDPVSKVRQEIEKAVLIYTIGSHRTFPVQDFVRTLDVSDLATVQMITNMCVAHQGEMMTSEHAPCSLNDCDFHSKSLWETRHQRVCDGTFAQLNNCKALSVSSRMMQHSCIGVITYERHCHKQG